MRKLQFCILIVIACFACGSSESGGFTPPGVIHSEWTLAGSMELPVAGIPPEVSNLGLKQALRAEYQGPRELAVVVFEMNAGVGAFELMQKWRHEEGRLAFYTGRWFVVLESAGTEKQVLDEIAGELETDLGSL